MFPTKQDAQKGMSCHQCFGKPAPKTRRVRKKVKFFKNDNVAVCLDNTSMEDRFDEGIEYIFESILDDGFIEVYDKFGELQVCFKNRFRVISEKVEAYKSTYVKEKVA